MSQEDLSLEKALEIIKQIAERHERDMAACEVAARIDRDRRNTLHAEAATGSNGDGDETL